MLTWRLGEVMARYRIKGTDLAQFMGISDNALSHYKRARSMPQINGERLNALLNGLNQLKSEPEPEITVTDLIDYKPD